MSFHFTTRISEFHRVGLIVRRSAHSIASKVVSGEELSVTTAMTSSWLETHSPTLLSRYKLDDIYNADEFGLFYAAPPNTSLHLKGTKCSGGKNSKNRITGLVGSNAVGDKLPLLIIGKSKKPRCFKNVKSLPCNYRNQKKSWMDCTIFSDWLLNLDAEMARKKRKIPMLVDNCPAHPEVPDLKAIELIFLPPNTTSKLQPMDQGVIRS